MIDTPEQIAMAEAGLAVGKLLATAKNPRTVLGQMKPGSVAWHAAWEAVHVYQDALDRERLAARKTTHNHFTRDIKPPGQCPACDKYHERRHAAD